MCNCINIQVVIFGAIGYYMFGAVWYYFMRNQWMKALGKKQIQKEWTQYLFSFSLIFVTAIIYSLIFKTGLSGESLLTISISSAILCLGLAIPPLAVSIIWSNSNKKLILIDGGYHLGGYIILGLVNYCL